jgi:malate/lactate dehydrogenase
MAGPKAMNVHPKNTDAVILGLGPTSTQVSLFNKTSTAGPFFSSMAERVYLSESLDASLQLK